jgi:hypothetical protein
LRFGRGRKHQKKRAETNGGCGPAKLHTYISLGKSAAKGRSNRRGVTVCAVFSNLPSLILGRFALRICHAFVTSL